MIALRLVLIAALVVAGGDQQKTTAPARPTADGVEAPAPARPTADGVEAPPLASDAGAIFGGLSGADVLANDELGVVPNVRLGTVTVAAPLDLEAIMNRLRRELPRVRTCFRSDVAPRPRRPLTLRLTLLVDHEGRVGHVNVKGTDELAIRQCMFGTLITTTGFPPAPGTSAEVEASLIVTPVR